MLKGKKALSILLTLVMLITMLAPAFAEITVSPEKETYESGEKVTVTAEVYDGDTKITGGIEWYYYLNGEKNNLSEDGDEIEFTVPNNNSDQTVASVVYATYGSQTQKVNIDIDPQGSTEPLKIVSQSPAHEATEVDEDAEIYFTFNKPVKIDDSKSPNKKKASFYYDSNYDGETDERIKYPLVVDEQDHRKVRIQLKDDEGKDLLLGRKHRYSICICSDVIIAENNEEDKFEGTAIDEWTFETKKDDIVLYADSRTVTDNTTLQLKTKLKAEDENKKIIFESSDPEIATIDENGLLTGIKSGEVTITAYLGEEPTKKGEIKITVESFKPDSIEIKDCDYMTDKYEHKLLVGERVKLGVWAKKYPENNIEFSDKVNFTSANPEIADFDEEGYLVAKKAGLVEITAAAKAFPEKKYTAIVEIRGGNSYQLVPKWRYISNNPLSTPVVASDGSVYTVSYSEILALNSDGTLKENFVSPKNIATKYFKIANLGVQEYLLAAGDKWVRLLDLETGNIVWQKELYGEISVEPVISEDSNIYILCSETYYDFDKEDEETKKVVYAFNINDEKYLWKKEIYDMTSSFTEIISAIKGSIYVIGDNKIYNLSTDGEILWQFENTFDFNALGKGKNFAGKPVVGIDGIVYVHEGYNTLYAIDPNKSDGFLWQKKFERILSKDLIIDQDKKYCYISVSDEDGRYLAKVNVQTGDIEDKYTCGGEKAVVGQNGYLYTNKESYLR